MGGGENHRFALYDMIMLQDDFAGGIALAVAKTKKLPQGKRTRFKIIVEARDLNEVKEIVACEGVYRILLDNFDYEMTRKAVLLLGIKA
jgi:nicotinate-nucleotide pyrophosphorylase (carboxylating)